MKLDLRLSLDQNSIKSLRCTPSIWIIASSRLYALSIISVNFDRIANRMLFEIASCCLVNPCLIDIIEIIRPTSWTNNEKVSTLFEHKNTCISGTQGCFLFMCERFLVRTSRMRCWECQRKTLKMSLIILRSFFFNYYQSVNLSFFFIYAL